MKTIATGIALFICVCSYCQRTVTNDTLYFSNGSVVIGKIKIANLGVVTFDPADANDITVQLRKLKTIKGGNRIFRLEDIRHHIYFGIIIPHPTSNTISIATDSDTVSIDLEEIAILYPLEKTLVQRFSGSVGIGYTYTRSSGFGRLNVDGRIKYTSMKNEVSLTVSSIYSIYDSLFSRDKEDANLKYNYYFVSNWFATAFLAHQRNLELGLERRFQEGLGIGNKFITRRDAYVWSRVGLVFNEEKSTDDEKSGVLTEVFGQLELNFFKFERPKINFLLTQTIYYSLSESGRFRNDGSLNVTWEIFKDFRVSFEPYNSYDSKPPGSDSETFDFGIVFGINYVFPRFNR